MTEKWPSKGSGAGHSAPGESWGGINNALEQGKRGLPGGESNGNEFAGKKCRSQSQGSEPREATALTNAVYEPWRSGQHDDLVLALAMAAWAAEKGRTAACKKAPQRPPMQGV